MLAASRMVTRRWRGVLAMAVCLALIHPAAAVAQPAIETTSYEYGDMVDYGLVFPVLGDYSLRDTFYAARYNGDHHAQDIMSDKMTPIVATNSGTIRYINWTRDASEMWTNDRCCSMSIDHDDGWRSTYIHMNNDTPGTDDGQGWGIAAGLEPGDHVEAGQHIGWVGDSGNAEYTGSHLHYELYAPNGVAVNPYEALLAADTVDEPFVGLGHGSTGQAVLQLQTMLAVVGFDPGPADAVFGDLTQAALISFQQAAGLDPTGVAGSDTWNALTADYVALITPPNRLAGADRYETAAAIADALYPTTTSTVFIAVGTNFPDAIAAGPAASALDAPILLVRSDAVPDSTRQALLRLGPEQIFILGGEVAVHPGVETEVRGIVPDAVVSRLAGPTRYETAVAVSDAGFPGPVDTVYVATGASFADALVAAPAAVSDGAPVLLVTRYSIPPAVLDELARLSPNRIVVVGGTSAVSSSVYGQLAGLTDSIVRISGPDRFTTSALVAQFAFPEGAAAVHVAIGSRFPDALAGGPATGHIPGPLLLVETDSIPMVIADEVRRLDPETAVVLGGPAAVSESVAITIPGLPWTAAPAGNGDSGSGPPEIVYDPSQDSEQWRPLVEYVFAKWDLDVEKCGTGTNSSDCIGGQVDNAIVIMECESFGDPTIVNPTSGTMGLFQHHPDFWEVRVDRVRSHFPDFPSTASAFEPYDNVMVAALLVDESRDALIGENSLTGPWDDGPEPWGHWVNSARNCADPPLVVDG